jgi:tetratricopeptide (TPR) repeat protein
LRALEADSKNPVALKNLGAIFGKDGDRLKALYFLRRSFEIEPHDQQTVYGIAFACLELGDIEQAQKHFQNVLEMDAAESLRVLAKNGLREIASRELKAKMLNVGLIHVAISRYKENGPSPEFFVGIMLLQSWAYWIALTDVNSGQLSIFWRAYEDIDPWLGEFLSAFHRGQDGTWAYNATASPIGLGYYA